MPTAKIKMRAFTYYESVPHPSNPDQTIKKSRIARRGEEVELSDEDYARGESLDAFVTDEDEQDEQAEFNVVDASDDELVDWIEDESPTVAEVVEAANNDPESARRLLAAEDSVTDGEPRKGVEEGLTAIIEG